MTSRIETPLQKISYLSMVWSRLQRNRIAVFGLWCILVLVIVAVYAPFLAHNQPLIWNDGSGTKFPFFASLFNRLLFENSVDILFNLLLVFSPVYVAAYVWARRKWRDRFVQVRLRLLAVLSALHFVVFLAIAPQRFGPLENPWFFTEKVHNYLQQQSTMEEHGGAVTAVFPLRHYSYRDTDPGRNLEAPSRAHWLGTDTEGRDVFARMIYGTRISLTIGVVAVSIYVLIGIFLGALAGYFGGRVDMWISRLIEVMICFPSFFLILTIAALIEKRSIFHVMVIIGVTSWTGVARLIRAEFLKQKNLEYVQAAIALGIRRHRIIFGHILPNAIAPVLVSATFGIATAILIESSLAFLGVGDLTVASWGETLNTGRTEQKLWLVLAPGIAIFFVVSIFNLVGEGLRDALDPKLDT